MNTQITEYTQTEAALALLRENYGIYGQVGADLDLFVTKNMAVAKEARAEVRGYRVALEKLRVELKAPALERTRLIDAEAKRITAELLAIEEPIDNAVKAEERRKEEEKTAKARAEAQRVAGIQRRIAAIRALAGNATGQRAAAIAEIAQQVTAIQINPADYGEFLPDALDALAETRQQVAAMLATQQQFEEEQARIQAEQAAEQARIQAEREELAQLQAKQAEEQARVKAEQDRIQAEQAAEQARIQAEQDRIQAEREALARLQAKQAEEQARIQAEKAAKARKAKAKADPTAGIKADLDSGKLSAHAAIEAAYQRGYQDGQALQQAA